MLVNIQVRLMLVLAPAACCLAGVAVHEALLALFRGVHGHTAAAAAAPRQEASPVRPTKKAAKAAAKASLIFNHSMCISRTLL